MGCTEPMLKQVFVTIITVNNFCHYHCAWSPIRILALIGVTVIATIILVIGTY